MQTPAVQTFQALYALSKHIIGIPPGRTNVYVRTLLVVFTLLITVVLSILIILFGLFYFILKLYIKYKNGKNFARMMTGQDPQWHGPHIHMFFTVEATQSYEETVKKINKNMEKLYESCDRLSYLTRSCLGYKFYVRSNLKVNDYFTEIDCEDIMFWTKSTLVNYLQNNFMQPHHLGDRTWRFLYFKQPIHWLDGTEHYGFVLTVNHCISDGVGLIGLLKNKICDEFEYIGLNPRFQNSDVSKFKSLDDAYVFPISHKEQFNNGCDSEALLSFFIENEAKFVSILKEIKRKLVIGFSDILLSGFSVAFTEYVEKKHNRYQSLRLNNTVQIVDKKVIDVIEGNYDYNDITNKMVFTSLNLETQTRRDMLKTILKLKCLSQEYMASVNINLTRVINRILHILPPPLAKIIFEAPLSEPNIALSNVSGIKLAKIMDLTLRNITFFMCPATVSTFVIIVVTDGEKFRLSAMSRTGIIDNDKDMNEIVRRAFEHIELLHNKLKQEDLREISFDKR